MKFILLLCLAFSLIARSSGQTVTGRELEIGPSGSNQVTHTWSSSNPPQVIPALNSAAIGTGNEVRKNDSLAVGWNNIVEEVTSMALGLSNRIGTGIASDGMSSLAVGQHNYIDANQSLAVGYGNQLDGDSYDYPGSVQSVIFGAWNLSRGDACMAVGFNNYIEGMSDDTARVEATAVIGRGLITRWNHALIVGQYNDSDIPQNSGLLFAVGNGAMSGPRSNAMEVYLDGRIKMPRQGDILMGEFGNPGD